MCCREDGLGEFLGIIDLESGRGWRVGWRSGVAFRYFWVFGRVGVYIVALGFPGFQVCDVLKQGGVGGVFGEASREVFCLAIF